MRKRKSPLPAPVEANGFVNRRSTVQSRPPAQTEARKTTGAARQSPRSVTGPSADLKRARFVLHLVKDHGFSYGAAVRLEGRAAAAVGRGLPDEEMDRIAHEAVVEAIVSGEGEAPPAGGLPS